MSFRRDKNGTRSVSAGRHQRPRYNSNDSDIDSSPKIDSLPNVLPELTKIVRKLLPSVYFHRFKPKPNKVKIFVYLEELPLNIDVRNVDYIENGCERLSGTLYMTTFRLVFSPDNETGNNNLVISGNKYIGEYDIPLTSIYKINVAPVDSRSGFKSFLNENQIQSETRTFTIITRDFRNITFTKCSVTKSNSFGSKQQISTSKMETYINELRIRCHFQDKEQLYPYLAFQKNPPSDSSPRSQRGYTLSSLMSSSGGRSMDDDIADFCISNDERIKSYMTYQDWNDELYDANEKEWIVDKNKFNKAYVVQSEGPFVRLSTTTETDSFEDLIWHWTHTSEVEIDRRHKQNKKHMQYMLITVPGIGEITVAGDPLRLSGTDSSLTYTCHYIYEQPFQRYNLAKFPCNLKRLQASYEKLIEICVTSPEDDDDKWLTKLNTCKWLKYVSKALHGAASLAKLLNYKNIQLAGSDTDNSCLMSSLIQIFLRPKCRTMKGFCELIVREWLIRGHPFRERFGQVTLDTDGYTAQESPVFLLFLDCIQQLINQNPFSFEFTDYFLIELYHDICYCYHHTFAFNSVVERLHAIKNCPKNILILSSFDFSLYLYPDTYRLLKNNASIFNSQNSSFPLQLSKDNSPSRRSPNRIVYRLEPPKSANSTSDNSLLLNAEQFEYDTIESPQKFTSDLQVDWRIFNIVLWSKCYCRYDQNYLPTLREQQLSFEISCLQEDLQNARTKSRRHMTVDALHSINHANSWHPQMLETHV